jgi:Plasmid pRiA4b ORF-3-like protein
VTVEDVLLADADERYPWCLDGAGSCPPEDVGGTYGYERFLAAIADPGHPEHVEIREWYGRDFDPRRFDPERATALMRRMA